MSDPMYEFLTFEEDIVPVEEIDYTQDTYTSHWGESYFTNAASWYGSDFFQTATLEDEPSTTVLPTIDPRSTTPPIPLIDPFAASAAARRSSMVVPMTVDPRTIEVPPSSSPAPVPATANNEVEEPVPVMHSRRSSVSSASSNGPSTPGDAAPAVSTPKPKSRSPGYNRISTPPIHLPLPLRTCREKKPSTVNKLAGSKRKVESDSEYEEPEAVDSDEDYCDSEYEIPSPPRRITKLPGKGRNLPLLAPRPAHLKREPSVKIEEAESDEILAKAETLSAPVLASAGFKKVKLENNREEWVDTNGNLICGWTITHAGKSSQYTLKNLGKPEVGAICKMRCINRTDLERHRHKTLWHADPKTMWKCPTCQKTMNSRIDNQTRHLPKCRGGEGSSSKVKSSSKKKQRTK